MGYTAPLWVSFGEALAAVAGTLTGRLFVAVSVKGAALSTSRSLGSRAAQTLALFMTSVLIALSLVAPQPPAALGWELLVLAAVLGATLSSRPPWTTNVAMIALWRLRLHNGAMPSVQIKDVPERTHAVLRQRAAAAHQSLQEYLRARLIEEADQPTLEEILDRAGGRSGGSVPFKAAVAAIRDDRARR